MVEALFFFCVRILEVIGDFTGMGYHLANLVIFVVVHPAITLVLFFLWRRERSLRKEAMHRLVDLTNP